MTRPCYGCGKPVLQPQRTTLEYALTGSSNDTREPEWCAACRAPLVTSEQEAAAAIGCWCNKIACRHKN